MAEDGELKSTDTECSGVGSPFTPAILSAARDHVDALLGRARLSHLVRCTMPCRTARRSPHQVTAPMSETRCRPVFRVGEEL